MTKIVFLAPRYHTNQNDLVTELLKNFEVSYITQYRGNIESGNVENNLLGYSLLSLIISKILYRNNIEKQVSFLMNKGLPPLFKAFNIIKNIKPDILIVRNTTPYSLLMIVIAKILNITPLVYDQIPVYLEERKKIKKLFVERLFCKFRYTPVLGKQTKIKDENTFYIPFVKKISKYRFKKKYFTNKNINLLIIAKAQNRKRIYETVDAIKEILLKNEEIRLTLLMQVVTNSQKLYLENLNKLISENKLNEKVRIKLNVDYSEMEKVYLNHDIFIMPSTNEPASVSQLEAMACGLPVIIGSDNGTANYITHGRNGYIFKNGNFSEILIYLNKLITDKESIKKMGEESFKLVEENHSIKPFLKMLGEVKNGLI